MQPALHHVVMEPYSREGYLLLTASPTWRLYDEDFSQTSTLPGNVTEFLTRPKAGNKWLVAYCRANDLYAFTTPRLKLVVDEWDSTNYEIVCFSPDGSRLYFYNSDDRIGYISVNDLLGGSETLTYLTSELDISLASDLAVSPDGSRVSVSYSGGAREFDTSTGVQTNIYEPGGSSDYLSYISYSTEGMYLAGVHQYGDMVVFLSSSDFTPLSLDYPANTINSSYVGSSVFVDDNDNLAYVVTRDLSAPYTYYLSKYSLSGETGTKVSGEVVMDFDTISSDREVVMELSDDGKYLFISNTGAENGVLVYDYPDMVLSSNQINNTPGTLCRVVDIPDVGTSTETYTLPRTSSADISTVEVTSTTSEEFPPPSDWETHDYLLLPLFTRSAASVSSPAFSLLSEVEVGSINQRLLLYSAKVSDLSAGDFPLTVTQASSDRMGGGIFGVTTGTATLDFDLYEKPGRTDTYRHCSYPVVYDRQSPGNLFLFSTKTVASTGTPSVYSYEESYNLISLQRLAVGVQDTFWKNECYTDFVSETVLDDTQTTPCCDIALFVRGTP